MTLFLAPKEAKLGAIEGTIPSAMLGSIPITKMDAKISVHFNA